MLIDIGIDLFEYSTQECIAFSVIKTGFLLLNKHSRNLTATASLVKCLLLLVLHVN